MCIGGERARKLLVGQQQKAFKEAFLVSVFTPIIGSTLPITVTLLAAMLVDPSQKKMLLQYAKTLFEQAQQQLLVDNKLVIVSVDSINTVYKTIQQKSAFVGNSLSSERIQKIAGAIISPLTQKLSAVSGSAGSGTVQNLIGALLKDKDISKQINTALKSVVAQTLDYAVQCALIVAKEEAEGELSELTSYIESATTDWLQPAQVCNDLLKGLGDELGIKDISNPPYLRTTGLEKGMQLIAQGTGKSVQLTVVGMTKGIRASTLIKNILVNLAQLYVNSLITYLTAPNDFDWYKIPGFKIVKAASSLVIQAGTVITDKLKQGAKVAGSKVIQIASRVANRSTQVANVAAEYARSGIEWHLGLDRKPGSQRSREAETGSHLYWQEEHRGLQLYTLKTPAILYTEEPSGELKVTGIVVRSIPENAKIGQEFLKVGAAITKLLFKMLDNSSKKFAEKVVDFEFIHGKMALTNPELEIKAISDKGLTFERKIKELREQEQEQYLRSHKKLIAEIEEIITAKQRSQEGPATLKQSLTRFLSLGFLSNEKIPLGLSNPEEKQGKEEKLILESMGALIKKQRSSGNQSVFLPWENEVMEFIVNAGHVRDEPYPYQFLSEKVSYVSDNTPLSGLLQPRLSNYYKFKKDMDAEISKLQEELNRLSSSIEDLNAIEKMQENKGSKSASWWLPLSWGNDGELSFLAQMYYDRALLKQKCNQARQRLVELSVAQPQADNDIVAPVDTMMPFATLEAEDAARPQLMQERQVQEPQGEIEMEKKTQQEALVSAQQEETDSTRGEEEQSVLLLQAQATAERQAVEDTAEAEETARQLAQEQEEKIGKERKAQEEKALIKTQQEEAERTRKQQREGQMVIPLQQQAQVTATTLAAAPSTTTFSTATSTSPATTSTTATMPAGIRKIMDKHGRR